MAKIEKALCVKILNKFYEQDSHQLTDDLFAGFVEELGVENFVNHIDYLYGNLLITSKSYVQSIDGNYSFYQHAKITAKGIDYLEGEDSLGHELNVTTVKLHSQTINDLETIIKNSNLSAAEKEGLLKELSVHGAKEVITKSVDHAMANGAVLLMIIKEWVKSQIN